MSVYSRLFSLSQTPLQNIHNNLKKKKMYKLKLVHYED